MLVNVGSVWARRQAQGAGLTGVTASFLGLLLVRGLCPTCGDDQPRADALLRVIFLHVAPPLTRSSDAELVKLLFQVTGGTKSPTIGPRLTGRMAVCLSVQRLALGGCAAVLDTAAGAVAQSACFLVIAAAAVFSAGGWG